VEGESKTISRHITNAIRSNRGGNCGGETETRVN